MVGVVITGPPVVIGPAVVEVMTGRVAATLVKVPVQSAPAGQQATLPALSSVQIALLAQQAEPEPGRERKEQEMRFAPQPLFCLRSSCGES